MNPDLILTIMDAWVLNPQMLQRWKTACWTPVDCSPLGAMDTAYLTNSGSIPIAMTHFGEKMLKDAGFMPLYAPHGIDTNLFTPPDSQANIRKELNAPKDAFIVGINAANKDAVRKSFPQQFEAFARFRKKHDDALLYVHSATQAPQALSLLDLAKRSGIMDCIRFSDQYAYVTGRIQQSNMAAWYGSIDVLSNVSHGEGFGLAPVEAQACGTPVVVGNNSTSPELLGAGWLVNGEPFWNAAHQAYWQTPHVDEIVDAYEQAYTSARDPELKKKAREFALQYDAGRVLTEYWIPVLKEIQDS